MSDEQKNSTDNEEIKGKVGLIIGLVLAIVIFGGIVWFLLITPYAERIRDITIIFLAAEGLLIGLASVILIVQLAKFVNLIQNEVKPLLEAANETIRTVRGTATFLSDSLVEPVMKMSGLLAIFKKVSNTIDDLFGSKK